jgi:hypothetical protein
MSYVPKLEVHLDEESYVRLMRAASSRALSAQDFFTDIVHEYLAEMGGAEEALQRLERPEPPVSLEEMKRRLAS